MTFLILFSALFISTIAAWFSIVGLITIFPGAAVAIGLMGTALELGKLVSASWLYRFWNKTNALMKMYFIGAIVTLSFITSIGIFGYLSRAHIEGTQGLDANTEQVLLLDEQIKMERETVVNSRMALQQMNTAVNNLVINEKTTERAIAIRSTQRRERELLNASVIASNKKIAALSQERAVANVGKRKLETEVGPIKYVAQLVYGKDDTGTIDKAVRLLTLMLMFVFDPLAILMVIAANLTMKENSGLDTPPKNKTLAFEFTDENTHRVNNSWNPGSWFKIVKRPK